MFHGLDDTCPEFSKGLEPKQYVLNTIKSPQKIIKSYKERLLLQRQFGGKILEVVTIKEEDILTVITQYWLEEES